MKKNLLLVALLISGASFGQVISEDFEGLGGALPAGWVSTTVAAGAWETGDDATANAGDYWPVPAHTDFAQANDDVCNCDMSAVYLESPSMDLTGLSGVMLSFEAYEDGGYGQNPYSVELSVNNGGAWNSLFTGSVDAAQWNSESMLLGASADGVNGVKIRFKYDDAGEWASGSAIDNVVVKVPTADDAALAVSLQRYAPFNSNLPLEMLVTNAGINQITSITADWNDGVSHSQQIAVNIAPGASANVSHPDLVTYALAVERSIDVTITLVNGVTDTYPSNNSAASMLHNTVSQIVPKMIVFEEGTGTWCGWCPRGEVAMEYMENTNGAQFIGIAVHNGDPMTLSAYDNGVDLSGYPGSNIDRALLGESVSNANWGSIYNARKDIVVPADISVVSSGSNSSVVLDVSATFYTVFAASNYRLAVVLYEDGVTGTASGYNQANYYSGGGAGVMGGYESLNDPVPAAQMVYNKVGRALLGGYDGQAGSVPAAVTDLMTASYTFNYTVPSSQNRENMHAVALLIDQTNGEIVNAGEIPIPPANIGLVNNETIGMSVFPNPANDILNVSFELEGDAVITITDMQGRVVVSTEYSNLSGAQTIALPVAELLSGNYILSVATEGASYNEVVVIK